MTGFALPPLLVAALAVLLFTGLDSLVKSLPADLPVLEIVALRYAMGVPLAMAIAWPVRRRLLAGATWRANGMRGVLVLGTAGFFFFGLRTLPFAEVLALSFLAPLFLALFAALLLGEPVSRMLAGALALGFGGVAVILGSGLFGAPVAWTGAAAALGSAVTYALGNVLLRRQAQRDPGRVIVLIQHIVPAALAAPFAWADWVAPDPRAWATLAGVAGLGLGGHFCLAWAYGRAPAGRLGVMEYTALPWAAGIGYLAFGEVPAPTVWAGAALIVTACLLAARRQKA